MFSSPRKSAGQIVLNNYIIRSQIHHKILSDHDRYVLLWPILYFPFEVMFQCFDVVCANKSQLIAQLVGSQTCDLSNNISQGLINAVNMSGAYIDTAQLS